MRSDHAVLIGSRGSPLGRGLADHKTGYGYEANAFLRRIKAVSPDVDLDIFLIRIRSAKVGIDYGFIFIGILFGIPLKEGCFLLPGHVEDLRLKGIFQLQHFIHRMAVQVHFTRVDGIRSKIPVARHRHRVGVVAAKDAVSDTDYPGISLIFFPALDHFRAGDDRAKRFLRAVHDAGILSACIFRIHIFPVNTGTDDDFVTGLRDQRRFIDRFKRSVL